MCHPEQARRARQAGRQHKCNPVNLKFTYQLYVMAITIMSEGVGERRIRLKYAESEATAMTSHCYFNYFFEEKIHFHMKKCNQKHNLNNYVQKAEQRKNNRITQKKKRR